MAAVDHHRFNAHLVSLVMLVFSATLRGADWPQWRGLERNGFSPETDLLEAWPEAGPAVLWTASGIGAGFSSPVIVADTVYVTGRQGEREVLTALDGNGARLWSVEYGGIWAKSFKEARTTPTVVDDLLYVISGAGEVVCIGRGDGNIVWSVSARDRFRGRTGPWGTAENPLVVDDIVVYTPAGPETTVIALDRRTGELVWQSPSVNDQSAYVSPILATHGGTRHIVAMTGDYVVGVNPSDGALAWTVKYADIDAPAKGGSINCVTPLHRDGRVLVTSGYNHAAVLLELAADGTAAKPLWSRPLLDTHHGGVVLVDGFIYGANWENNKAGNWVCLDWETGDVRYDVTWHTKGSVITADGMLYCYEEGHGHVALVKATPDAFRVVSSFQFTEGNGPHWAHPAISDGRLYIRHGDVLKAFDIRE